MQDIINGDDPILNQLVQPSDSEVRDPVWIVLLEEVKSEELVYDNTDLEGCTLEYDVKEPERKDTFGECDACHKVKRLWSGVCSWCGADPEDFDEE